MMMARFGLFSVLLTLLWWMPHAEVTSADGYDLEQAYVEIHTSTERQSPDEPDGLVSTVIKSPRAVRYAPYTGTPPAAPFTYTVFDHQSRAPPQTIC